MTGLEATEPEAIRRDAIKPGPTEPETTRPDAGSVKAVLPGGATRVLVYGVTGSGKSTLAAALASASGSALHLADEEFGWLPGWTPRPPEQMRAMAAEAAAEDAWVFDSAYSAFRDLVLARTQLIIGLDYSRLRTLARLLPRTVQRITRKELICNGNRETWRGTLSKDSILLWHFRSFAKKRRAMRSFAVAAANDSAAPQVILFKNPRQTAAWLRSLELCTDAPDASR